MNSISVKVMLASLAFAAAMTGCAKKAPTPEQACAGPETYDQLTQIIATQIAEGSTSDNAVAAASSKDAIARAVRFTTPTVDDVNASTKKVSCKAILRVTIPRALQSYLQPGTLVVNEVAPDHIDYQVAYSIQPTADDGKNAYSLEDAGDVAAVALGASVVAVKHIQDAAGISASPPLETPDETGSASDDRQAIPDSDPANLLEPPSNGTADQATNAEAPI